MTSNYNDLSSEERIKFLIEHMDMNPEYARFVVAMEDGDVSSDVVFVDEEKESSSNAGINRNQGR